MGLVVPLIVINSLFTLTDLEKMRAFWLYKNFEGIP